MTPRIAKSDPQHYTVGQDYFLHWSIAALVIWQLVFGDSMGRAGYLARRGIEVDGTTQFLASRPLSGSASLSWRWLLSVSFCAGGTARRRRSRQARPWPRSPAPLTTSSTPSSF